MQAASGKGTVRAIGTGGHASTRGFARPKASHEIMSRTRSLGAAEYHEAKHIWRNANTSPQGWFA
ncbi:hypothetical protein [Streptomyces cyaneus]|uniref:hypothetical protein n=1 Tax=Streptomyces cyaneus TaxID=1904 RepID=UPI000FF8999C|nr:hypothetical protein [Streptomyces cyaneus]